MTWWVWLIVVVACVGAFTLGWVGGDERQFIDPESTEASGD